jgi:hypothetical protein
MNALLCLHGGIDSITVSLEQGAYRALNRWIGVMVEDDQRPTVAAYASPLGTYGGGSRRG